MGPTEAAGARPRYPPSREMRSTEPPFGPGGANSTKSGAANFERHRQVVDEIHGIRAISTKSGGISANCGAIPTQNIGRARAKLGRLARELRAEVCDLHCLIRYASYAMLIPSLPVWAAALCDHVITRLCECCRCIVATSSMSMWTFLGAKHEQIMRPFDRLIQDVCALIAFAQRQSNAARCNVDRTRILAAPLLRLRNLRQTCPARNGGLGRTRVPSDSAVPLYFE